MKGGLGLQQHVGSSSAGSIGAGRRPIPTRVNGYTGAAPAGQTVRLGRAPLEGRILVPSRARPHNGCLRARPVLRATPSEDGPGPSSPSPSLAPVSSLTTVAASLQTIQDTNTLQTALAAAIAAEDFSLAASIRDRLKAVMGSSAARIDWSSIAGLPEWLSDRAQRLGFKFPTEVQRRACGVISAGADTIIASETGSGKTLCYLLPTLARLRYPPDMFLDDLKGPAALIVVPTLELGAQVAMSVYRLMGGTVSSAANARPGDDANMYTYFGPKGIKVRGVLNREEVVMSKQSLTYLAQAHVVVGTPAAIMEAYRAPEPVTRLLKHLQVVVVDEVDECFATAGEDMAALLEAATGHADMLHSTDGDAGGGASAGPGSEATAAAVEEERMYRQLLKPQVVFVGATQRPEVIDLSVRAGWLCDPVEVQVGRAGAVPAGLVHRYLVVEEYRRLAVLVRSLRQDLQAAGPDSAPARVVLFTNTGDEAAVVAEPLSAALWTDHRMTVLLPPGTPSATSKAPGAAEPSTSSPAGRSGAQQQQEEDTGDDDDDYGMFAYDPLRALQLFRDCKATLLLATGQAARGLDLPAVSHVYSLGLPPDKTQYLHRAGRAGRIGSMGGGTVTTIVTPAEVAGLMALADSLGITLEQMEEAQQELLLPLAGQLQLLEAEAEAEAGPATGGASSSAAAGPAQGGSAPATGREGGAGAAGQQQGSSTNAAGQPQAQLGDVEKLRKGLEDLFNLM